MYLNELHERHEALKKEKAELEKRLARYEKRRGRLANLLFHWVITPQKAG